MANPLIDLYKNSPYNTANSTPAMLIPQVDRETLPNGGGSFTPLPSMGGFGGETKITPAPIFNAASTGGASAPVTPAPVEPAPVEPAPVAPSNNFYDKYKDPKTGEIMSPEEYAIYLGNKIPKGNGEIPNYAGDAMTNPNETANELNTRATNLNNSRNDIATGETDPYKVGNKSGIAYSPQELAAIEKAYAGVYDPALNDVFSRLSDKKKEDERKAAMEERVFATNEAIRQWRATTGTKSSGKGSGDDEEDTDTEWTDTQLRSGASTAGLSIEAFKDLDDDVKNYYYNPPMGLNTIEGDPNKPVPMYEVFDSYYKQVANGNMEASEMADLIKSSSLPEPVKIYTTYLIPKYTEEEDEGIDWFWKSKWLK